HVSKRVGVLVQKDIPDIALGIEKGARRDVFERVRDRAAHAAANVDAGPGVGSERHIALENIARFSCVDDNRAADCITSVERALRPFQYLDGVDVEELLKIGRAS